MQQAVAQWVKSQLEIPKIEPQLGLSCTDASWEGVDDDPNTQVPVTNMGNPVGIPGFGLAQPQVLWAFR